MASTGKTPNYSLNQWVKTDPVLMADFNADNQVLDSALKQLSNGISAAGNCRIATGCYSGTGNYGASSPNTLSFDFAPSYIIISVDFYNASGGQDNIYTINQEGIKFFDVGAIKRTVVRVPAGTTVYCNFSTSNSTGNYLSFNVSGNGRTISWWSASTSYGSALYQSNSTGYVYHYTAIG